MNEIKQISQLKSIKPNSTDAFAIDSVFGKDAEKQTGLGAWFG